MYKHKINYVSFDDKTAAVVPSLDKMFVACGSSVPRAEYLLSDSPPLFPIDRHNRVKRVLVLTSGCNLNCSYCFEGMQHSRRDMTTEQIKDIVTELFNEAASLKKDVVSFSLFGGEPTINWDCVLTAIRTARQMEEKSGIKCIKAIVTNGVMSTDKAQFLAENFENVYFSVDGPEDIFTHHRRPKNNGIFNVIINNARCVYKLGCNIGFKITVTSYSIERMTEIENFFLLNFPLSSRMYQPVMTEPDDEMYVDFNLFLKKFRELKQYTPNKNVSCSLYKYEPSDRMCNLSIRNVIYPDMDVLACHRSNMCIPEDNIKANFFIGRCKDGKITYESDKVEYMKSFYVDNIPACKECFARYHCGGGCPTIKIMKGLDPLNDRLDYCDTLKKYFLSDMLGNLPEELSYPLPEAGTTITEHDISLYYKEI